MKPQRPTYTPPNYRTCTNPEDWQTGPLRSHWPSGGYPKRRKRKFVTGALVIVFVAALGMVAIVRSQPTPPRHAIPMETGWENGQ